MIGVLTPVLAGRVVNAIVGGGSVAAAAAHGDRAGRRASPALAVLEAVVGLVSRWFSARIGEGLIVDLRRAVFEHVQQMPVAFFTRTRTGALVSRLNNDVIGAQSAITTTLAAVLSNIIQLVLALAVMIGAGLAGHAAGADAAAGVRAAGPADGPHASRTCAASRPTSTPA